jgi:TctA family transporter
MLCYLLEVNVNLLNVFLWWLCGSVVVLVTVRSIRKPITVRDIILITIFGFLGPVTLIGFIQYAKLDWLDKRLF